MGMKNDIQSAISVEQRRTAANPGPGAYVAKFDLSMKKSGSYSLKSRQKEKETSFAPGPGAYSINAEPSLVKSPSVRFGSAS
jgi:hypothetical protein